MDWIENLKEPLTTLDILCGVIGYLMYKWGKIGFKVVKFIISNLQKEHK
jgi:hypothetical protein